MWRTGARRGKDENVRARMEKPQVEKPESFSQSLLTGISDEVRTELREAVMDGLNMTSALNMTRDRLVDEIRERLGKVANEKRISLNANEQQRLAEALVNEMRGFGPLEPLLEDDQITDIMVNGPNNVFVERGGKMVHTDVRFHDENHLLRIARSMAQQVNRQLDESHPMVDTRLPNGSRVNIVIPPVAIDGTVISIRRFSNSEITLDTLVGFEAISDQMKRFLDLASLCRLNIMISGGTSSGKTTLLNALSRSIGRSERIVTIEDSAELRLQQPHVVRLETRPTSPESSARPVTQRDLVSNALRMRPDRIILGEVRMGEAFDLLQAMNTGHEGSMGTMHANSTRDALSRLENMILMAGFELPMKAIRNQIASAVNLIIQAERLIDGRRRITKITEIVGIENETLQTQDLFEFKAEENKRGVIRGRFVSNKVNVAAMAKFQRYGMEDEIRYIIKE